MPIYAVVADVTDFTSLVSIATISAMTDRTAFQRYAMYSSSVGQAGAVDFFSNTSSLFAMAWRQHNSGSFTYDNPMLAFRRSGVAYQRIKLNASVPSVQVFSGGSWVSLNTAAQAIPSSGVPYKERYELVVHPTSGVFRYWINGDLYCEATNVNTQGDSPDTLVDAVEVHSHASSGKAIYFAEVLVRSEAISLTTSVMTQAPVANGNTVNFTSGGEPEVDDAGLNDSDMATSETAGQILQVTTDKATIPAGYAPVAVGVTVRARNTVSGPQNMDLGVRVSAADYWSAVSGVSGSFAQHRVKFEVNPADALPWEDGDFPIQIGVRSAA